MSERCTPAPDHSAVVSPLLLSDRLIALAEAADGAGYTSAAKQLVSLAYAVLDQPPRMAHY
jgi:hypothetical protein